MKQCCKFLLVLHLMEIVDCIHCKSALIGILESPALQFVSSVTQRETLEMVILIINQHSDFLV